ncbi:MAG: hypothetical protein A2X23_12620 [Chloroflexi bacterium GWC2_73_18]|nr:MAG: hypothetical protein A2X23_12620 [Chloroflexi bacterium GWC2_73_18]
MVMRPRGIGDRPPLGRGSRPDRLGASHWRTVAATARSENASPTGRIGRLTREGSSTPTGMSRRQSPIRWSATPDPPPGDSSDQRTTRRRTQRTASASRGSGSSRTRPPQSGMTTRATRSRRNVQGSVDTSASGQST